MLNCGSEVNLNTSLTAELEHMVRSDGQFDRHPMGTSDEHTLMRSDGHVFLYCSITMILFDTRRLNSGCLDMDLSKEFRTYSLDFDNMSIAW